MSRVLGTAVGEIGMTDAKTPDVPRPRVYLMPKASRVLAGLVRDGWVVVQRSGSHRTLVQGDQQRVWAFHDGVGPWRAGDGAHSQEVRVHR